MSRGAVRQAIAAFLAEVTITGLQKVYAAMPTLISGELINLGGDNGAGAVAWIHLDSSEEERWAVPSMSPAMAGGIKAVHYQVAVIVAYQYLIPTGAETPADGPDAWAIAEDAILQGIKDRIHSDPQLGTGPTGSNSGVVFEAAQRMGSLRISADEPVLEAGKVVSYHSIEFPVTEVIQA